MRASTAAWEVSEKSTLPCLCSGDVGVAEAVEGVEEVQLPFGEGQVQLPGESALVDAELRHVARHGRQPRQERLQRGSAQVKDGGDVAEGDHFPGIAEGARLFCQVTAAGRRSHADEDEVRRQGEGRRHRADGHCRRGVVAGGVVVAIGEQVQVVLVEQGGEFPAHLAGAQDHSGSHVSASLVMSLRLPG